MISSVKHLLVLLLCSCYTIVSAQYDFDMTTEHPYGLPNPDAPAAVKDFHPLIGSHNCKSEARNPDGTWADAEEIIWRWKYIMNGMGVQDETLKPDGAHSGSIRQYIADSSRWYVHYYSNKGPTTTLPTWEGTKADDGNIVLFREQQAPNGMDGFYRLTFSDISDQGYQWIGEWVNTDQSIVYPTWKIDCTVD